MNTCPQGDASINDTLTEFKQTFIILQKKTFRNFFYVTFKIRHVTHCVGVANEVTSSQQNKKTNDVTSCPKVTTQKQFRF